MTLFLFGAEGSAQTSTITNDVARPIEGAGHDYIKSFSETVNPANGSLSISLSLPVPKSRGFTLPVSLMYNSGSVNHFASPVPGVGLLVSDSLTSMSSGGWSDTLPYATASDWTEAIPAMLARTSAFCQYTSSYTFYDPSGTSHMLGIDGVSYLQGNAGGGSGVDPNTCQTLSGRVFLAFTSGSDSQVTATASENCNGIPGSGSQANSCNFGGLDFSVAQLDGTTYTFPWNQSGYFRWLSSTSIPNYPTTFSRTDFIIPTKIEDRNGNVIQVAANPMNPMTETITDTAGRPLVTVQRGPSYEPTSYTMGGQTYSVSWGGAGIGNYSLPSTPYATTKNLPNGVNCNLSLSVPSTYTQNGYGTEVYTSGPGGASISSITLPNGQQYTFTYGAYGLLTEIDYPNGGWVKYTWGIGSNPSTYTPGEGASWQSNDPDYNEILSFNGMTLVYDYPTSDGNACNFQYSTPVIATRTVGFSPGSDAALTQTFTYNTNWSTSFWGWTSKTTTVVTVDNITGKQSKTIYTYGSVGQQLDPDGNGNPTTQIPVENSIQYIDMSAPGTPTLKTVNKTWASQFLMATESTQLFNGDASQDVYCYGGYGFITQNAGQLAVLAEKDEYENIPFPSSGSVQVGGTSSPCNSATALRSTLYAYYGFGKSQIVNGHTMYPFATPQQVSTYQQGTLIAQTTAAFDTGSLTQASVPPGTWDSLITPYRGNPTSITRWSNIGNNSTKTFTYDVTGQVLSMTDGCGNGTCADMIGSSNHTTRYSYADNYTVLSGQREQRIHPQFAHECVPDEDHRSSWSQTDI